MTRIWALGYTLASRVLSELGHGSHLHIGVHTCQQSVSDIYKTIFSLHGAVLMEARPMGLVQWGALQGPQKVFQGPWMAHVLIPTSPELGPYVERGHSMSFELLMEPTHN